MSKDIGIINKIIGTMRNAKLSVIDTFGDFNSFIFEAPFMDDGFIGTAIDRLKAEYKRNADELTQYERFSDATEYREQIKELYTRQMSIRSELAYLFSHNPAKINECISLVENIKTEFTICLDAMKYYMQGDNELAYERFTDYIRVIDSIPEHFLACKMYASLLISKQRYKHAIPFCRKALEKRLEDIEVHNMLLDCYKAEQMNFELGVSTTIVQLLSCDNLGMLETNDKHSQDKQLVILGGD